MKAWIMENIRTKLAILAIMLGTAWSWHAHADGLAVRNCTWCHGASAQGYTPAPRLAGQTREYIENQLVSFGAHTRDNPFSKQYMWAAVANLSAETGRRLASYFSALPPKAANDGKEALAAMGGAIYQDGIPEENIVSCVACHGPNAEGAGEIPRLGGLDYSYLRRRLEQWGEGFHAGAKPPMPRIAGRLSHDQIDALASYLSFVK